MKRLFLLLLFVLGLDYLSAASVDSAKKVDIYNTIENDFLKDDSPLYIWNQLENVDLDKANEEVEIIFFEDDKVIGDMHLTFIFDQSDEIYKNRKKKKEKVAAIFWGLANAATSLAQVVGGKPKEGVTNFIGAVFGTAAQIAQIEANYAKHPELGILKNYVIFDLMVNMTEALYEIISEDNSRNTSLSRFPTLKELSLIVAYAERAAWVANKILDNTFVQNILKEALAYLEVYLHEHVDEVMEYLKEKLLVGYNDKAVVLSK